MTNSTITDEQSSVWAVAIKCFSKFKIILVLTDLPELSRKMTVPWSVVMAVVVVVNSKVIYVSYTFYLQRNHIIWSMAEYNEQPQHHPLCGRLG